MHSLSKSSNLAGYRAGFVAGDPALVAALLEVRKHAGMIVPFPVQAAMTAAASDDAHVAAQTRALRRRGGRCCGRRSRRRASPSSTPRLGCTCGPRRASRAGRPCGGWPSEGVLVAPGEFYGPAGERHVRVALTASDERIETAARRLARR